MLLSISLNNFQSWLYVNESSINYFEIPWHFLGAPLFYTFLTHYLGIYKKSIKIIKIAIPTFFILCITQLVFVFYFSGKGTSDELNYLFEKYRSIEEALSFISSISIFSYSFYILYKKEKLFSKILMFDNLKWIYTFFKLIVFVYLFWVVALIIRFKLNFTGFVFSYYPLRIFTTIVIYLLGYQGLRHLRIFKERKQIRKNINNNNDTKISETKNTDIDIKEEVETYIEEIITVVKKNDTDTDRTEKQFLEIDTYIKKSKKFLQPKYTLQNLSNDIGIGSSTLSAIINNNAHKSFIDYINEMRVKQVKKLLTNPKYSNYTIVSIGLESGFNSKSTFHNVFKKHANCTPFAYKELNKQTNESQNT